MINLQNANPALTAFVSDFVAAEMATTLAREGADLSDDNEVAFCLHSAGFGSRSIAALMDEARHRAQAAANGAGGGAGLRVA